MTDLVERLRNKQSIICPGCGMTHAPFAIHAEAATEIERLRKQLDEFVYAEANPDYVSEAERLQAQNERLSADWTKTLYEITKYKLRQELLDKVVEAADELEREHRNSISYGGADVAAAAHIYREKRKALAALKE